MGRGPAGFTVPGVRGGGWRRCARPLAGAAWIGWPGSGGGDPGRCRAVGGMVRMGRCWRSRYLRSAGGDGVAGGRVAGGSGWSWSLMRWPGIRRVKRSRRRCVAGVLSLADGAKVVAVRSRVLAAELAERGAMAAIELSRRRRWRRGTGAVGWPVSRSRCGERPVVRWWWPGDARSAVAALVAQWNGRRGRRARWLRVAVGLCRSHCARRWMPVRGELAVVARDLAFGRCEHGPRAGAPVVPRR